MQSGFHLKHDECRLSLFPSCRRHFSSFLGFPGWLRTLSLFCVINGTISLVAVVIKSNEVSNGWCFVESAVGNWGGGSLRWGSVVCSLSLRQWKSASVFPFVELVKSVIVLERRCFTAHCCMFRRLRSCSVWKVTKLVAWKKHASSLNASKSTQFVSWIMQRSDHWNVVIHSILTAASKQQWYAFVRETRFVSHTEKTCQRHFQKNLVWNLVILSISLHQARFLLFCV